MARLIKGVSEATSLVENKLTVVAPLLASNYSKWTQNPPGGFVITTDRAEAASGFYDTPEVYEIYKTFYLDHPAHWSSLTIYGFRFIDHEQHGGTARGTIILRRPDNSEVTLYNQARATAGWVYYLNARDIATYLNQIGTYTLILRSTVQSGFVAPSTYYLSESSFGALVLDIDNRLPGLPTNLSGHPEDMGSVHLLWVGGGETDYYKVYYKKPYEINWSYLTTTDQNLIVSFLDSGVEYSFKVSGVNNSGEGPATAEILVRSLSTFTKSFFDTVTPTEDFDSNNHRNVSFGEYPNTIETFNVQKISVPPVSSVILLCGTTNKIFTFESGLVTGFYDTPEMHFGYPDREKILCEIRFGSEAEVAHTIVVYVSTNGGATWTLIGSDTTGLGKIGFVYPWLTCNKCLVRFFGAGLYLFSYEVYAIPSGWKIQTS